MHVRKRLQERFDYNVGFVETYLLVGVHWADKVQNLEIFTDRLSGGHESREQS